METNKIAGIISIILGLIFIIFPIFSSSFTSIVIGLSLLFFGFVSLLNGLTSLNVVIGVISIIFGLLFMFAMNALPFLVGLQFYLVGIVMILFGIAGLIIFLISLAVFVYASYTNFSLAQYQNLPNMLEAVGLFIFIMCLDRLNRFESVKEGFIGNAILSLSICSYGMYFSHTIVVKALSYHNPGSNLMFPVMFVLIVFLSWLLPYVLSKIPYVKTFSGV